MVYTPCLFAFKAIISLPVILSLPAILLYKKGVTIIRIDTLVKELQRMNVRQSFIRLIPTVCECGYEMEVNDQLTALSCQNPICPYHMAAKMESMLKTLSVKDFGRTTCLDIIIKNKYIHHTQIFTMELKDFPDSFSKEYRDKLYKGLVKNKPRTFGEVLRACELTGLDSRALVLGKGYVTADEFYKAYNYDMNFIKDKLGIKNGTTPFRIHRMLIENEVLIRKVSSWFTLIREADFTVKVAITGPVTTVTREDGSKYSPREDFIKDLRYKYADLITIKLASTITSDVSYLISDKESKHGKYNTAKELGIPIVTCKKFSEIIDSVCTNIRNNQI